MTAPGTSSVSSATLATELRRCETRAKHLRSLVRDTRRALRDVADVRPIEEWAQNGVCDIGNIASRTPALVILGRCTAARARLTNAILGNYVLPTHDQRGGWRWIRLQYGICKQVRLSLGNSEFEVVETLQCNQKSWEVIPLEDLQRKEDSDLVTILDIELNSPILKEGLVILIPPDLGPDTSLQHEDFYIKRNCILNSYTPICLFALDVLGKTKTKQTLRETKSPKPLEKNTDVFCNVDNMYYFNKVVEPQDFVNNCDNKENFDAVLKNCDIVLSKNCGKCGLSKFRHSDDCCVGDGRVLETSVLSEENIHDIRTANSPYSNSNILFVLFSNSQQQQSGSRSPSRELEKNPNNLKKQEFKTISQEQQLLHHCETTSQNDFISQEKKTMTHHKDPMISLKNATSQYKETILMSPLDKEPIVQHKDPVISLKNATSQHKQTILMSPLDKEPIVQHKDSVISLENATSQHKQTFSMSPFDKELIVQHEEPISFHDKPTNQEPTTMHHEQINSDDKSTISQEKPYLISTEEQIHMSQESTCLQHEPMVLCKEPKTLHVEPTVCYNLPVIWNKVPTTSSREPTISSQELITLKHEPTFLHHKPIISHNEPISLPDRIILKNKLETGASEVTENCIIDMFNELPDTERSLSKSPEVILTDELQSVIINGDFVRDGVWRKSKKRRGKRSPGTDENGIMEGINDVEFDHKRDFMIDFIEQLEVSSNETSNLNFKGSWIILDDEKLIERQRQRQNPLSIFIKKTEQPKYKVAAQKMTKTVKSDSCQFDSLTEESCYVLDYPKLYSVLTKFVVNRLRGNLLENCTRLSEIHTSLLQQFILASFDMAREIQVVPKKIQYVAVTEQHLYDTLTEKFAGGEKKEELLEMMQKVLHDMRNTIHNTDWRIDDLPCHRETDLNSTYNSVFYCPTPLTRVPSSRNTLYSGSINTSMATGCSHKDTEDSTSFDDFSFEDYDIICTDELANSQSSEPQGSSINEEHPTIIEQSSATDLLIPNGIEASEESYQSQSVIRILNQRRESVGDSRLMMDRSRCMARSSEVSIKQASLEVQKMVLDTLSNNISVQLVEFVDCLRETYFGTLQRCIESLEESCREELGGRPATEAVRQVLSAARAVDLAGCASFSMLRTLVEHLRRFFYKLRVVGGGGVGSACCARSPRWRRQVALQTLHSLSAGRLARIISMQICERLRTSHERYQAALTSLETALAGRLHHTEDVKLSVRKRYAPGFARLCLESTSMCDLLKYGAPEMGREIGRGQYGVVFSCTAPWGGHEPCAVKSVLPADERHYNELAMEFFYTRSVPAHPRIVPLWGSVVERHPGICSPTVLLVSERLIRDLYCAIRTGDLCRTQRMRIAVDIVQGIRYLHSLGLVHRDITKKNVLLDKSHRAKLTDLGFCVPEALMSGSVVGTPIHMAPELLTGEYDSSVDVYAFGILFWYLCAGHAHLPTTFEVFKSKEQLWSRVRKGLRPERLSQFSDQAWNLMESCWAGEPALRPLLGDVQPILEQIMAESEQQGLANTVSSDEDVPVQKWQSPDELSMIWSKNASGSS